MEKRNKRVSCSPVKRPNPGRPAQARPAARNASTSKMKVVVRVRPQTEKEICQRRLVKPISQQMLVFDPKEEAQPFFYQGKRQAGRDMHKKENKAMNFTFDRVFDASASNSDVFEDTTKGILASLLDGFNCSVFVYGATGAGKTFTMLGSEGNPGITYLTMVELYWQIAARASERTFDVWVSYMEVYNENVRDLLNPKSGTALTLREDGDAGVKVAGLEVKVIHNADELLALLEQGNKNRTQHPTDANAESSRSHAIFQVYIRMTDRKTMERKLVKLTMIDLAGSERAAASGCKGLRFKEGANINKSLLALGNCINGLADGLKHIPYRNSKLTRILKDSLGGNCHTVMIANVSPAPGSFEDTYNTLKYATRAKKIETKLKSNIVSLPLPAQHYILIVAELQAELAQMQAEMKALKDGTSSGTTQHTGTEDEALKKAASEWIGKLRALYEDKKRLHIKIMDIEAKVQLLKFQHYLKIDESFLLKELDVTKADLINAITRNYSSLENNRLKMQCLQEKLTQIWVTEKQNSQELIAALDEVKRLELWPLVEKDINVFELELKQAELDAENTHLHRLSRVQHNQQENQKKYVCKITRAATSYYEVLGGLNKVTELMGEEYKDLGRMVVKPNSVKWGDAYSLEHQSPRAAAEEGLPLRIPPCISDCWALSFSKCGPQASRSNISALNGSIKTPPPSESRYSASYDTLSDFVRETLGADVLAKFDREVLRQDARSARDVRPAQNGCPRLVVDYDYDVETHFSPVTPGSRPVIAARPALDETYIAGLSTAHHAEPLNECVANGTFVVGDRAGQTHFCAENLNGTFDVDSPGEGAGAKRGLGTYKNSRKRPSPPSVLIAENLNGTFDVDSPVEGACAKKGLGTDKNSRKRPSPPSVLNVENLNGKFDVDSPVEGADVKKDLGTDKNSRKRPSPPNVAGPCNKENKTFVVPGAVKLVKTPGVKIPRFSPRVARKPDIKTPSSARLPLKRVENSTGIQTPRSIVKPKTPFTVMRDSQPKTAVPLQRSTSLGLLPRPALKNPLHRK